MLTHNLNEAGLFFRLDSEVRFLADKVSTGGTRTARLLVLAALCALVLAPASQAAQTDAQLISRGKAEAEIIWRRGFMLGDQGLDAEMQALLDTLTAELPDNPDVRLQVHVFRSPDLNAFALPDGSIFIFAGLLGELQTWDQVRSILAHEAQHALNSHAQKYMTQAKTKVALLEIVSLGAVVAIGTSDLSGAGLINSFSQLGLALATLASVNGYGRGLETEADLQSARVMQRTGCDPCAPTQALRALAKEADKRGRLTNFFWGNHPLLQDRIKTLEQESPTPCGDPDSSVAAAYLPTRRAMTKLTARLWLDAHKPARALDLCGAYLELAPDDPAAHCMLGEAYMASAATDTLDLAVAEFREALESSAEDYRDPYLGLACAVEKQGDTTSAIGYLERYLAGDARVPDRRMHCRRLEALKLRFPDAAAEPADTARAPAPPFIDATDVRPSPVTDTIDDAETPLGAYKASSDSSGTFHSAEIDSLKESGQ